MYTSLKKFRVCDPAVNQKQRGFTLIEVMIALIVLSIGLAGVAALLTTGMRSTGVASARSVATTHSQTGIEMMRANLDAYTAGWFSGSNTNSDSYDTVECTGPSGCTSEEQAANDYASWRTRIAASLPNGRGYICIDSTPDDGQPGSLACDGTGNNVTKLFWLDSRDDDTMDDGENFHRFATAVYP